MIMRGPWKKIVTVSVAVALAAIWADAAAAKKKHKPQHPEDSLITRDYDGTPIIMQGYHPRRVTPEEMAPERRTERPVHIPRGSSTYIPPPVPSPYSPNSPPAAALTQPTVQPYNPPPITTFSDRVTNAIHAYPLEKGIGNNPTDQQQFIRQRANQP
jgi:hypothetical protein